MAIKYNRQDLVKRYINGREVEKVMKNGVEIWSKPQPVSDDYLCFTANVANSSVAIHRGENLGLEISPDKQSWSDYSGEYISLNSPGDKIYFRNKSEVPTGFGSYFILYGSISASGDMNYLLCKHSTTVLTQGCFANAFAHFGGPLTTAPRLPATTLARECYRGMFSNCTSLIAAPELPATTLAQSCYQGMFGGCTSLTTAPRLPATALSYYCYQDMFSNCTSLTTAPELPATYLFNGCYWRMFENCTSLAIPPALPSTKSSGYGYVYNSMFRGCTSLIALPALPAISISIYDYENMFSGCANIKISETQEGEYSTPYRIPEYGVGTANTGALSNMFTDTGGTFRGTPEINRTYYTSNAIIFPTHSENYLCFTANEANSSVGLYKYGTPNEVELETSVDKQTWSDYTIGTDINLVNVGDKIYFRNKASGPVGFSNGYSNNYYSFYMRGSISASGDVNYLLCKYSTPYLTQYSFARLFSNCASLTTAPELPATTLAGACYAYMFEYCTSLTTAPSLSATTLDSGCYMDMFRGCTLLTTAPELPATTLARNCYNEMFFGCTSLTTAPELPATTLAETCYMNMFTDCTSLTIAPELPATTLAPYCYNNMFHDCTSLTTTPELPATTLAYECYEGMFSNCTSLITAPELPATTLVDRCYMNMFTGCTSLATLPELPALGMTSHCYREMFSGCSSIKISEQETGEYTTPYTIPTLGEGTGGFYSFYSMFADTGGTFRGTPEINRTYYTSNTVV